MTPPSPEALEAMIQHYIEATRRVLMGTLETLMQLSVPLVLLAGFLVLAAALTLQAMRNHGQNSDALLLRWRKAGGETVGYVLVLVAFLIGWNGLRTARLLAFQDIRWREAADVTKNPVPDAPPVTQYGPAVARLSEKPYVRSLTLPPDFLARLNDEGGDVLAPYLTDPTAGNLVSLRDTFRRNRRRVVFTRQATLINEEPIPFTDSRIDVKFRRLANRAYEAVFEGHYLFQNTSDKTSKIHFLFTLPDAGAVRDLSIAVDKQAIKEPITSTTGNSDTYEWKGDMQPQEKHEAVVRYRVNGARAWTYGLGSQRRRVEQFHLVADMGGSGFGFLRGSLQPTGDNGSVQSWDMSNVVTAQQIAFSFAPSGMGKKLYLQALSVLPVSLLLFLIGVGVCGYWFGPQPTASRLLAGVFLFAFGLGSSTVLAIYCGATIGLVAGPLIGAFLASTVLGRYSLLAALPVALLPATFLSEHNSGLMVFVLTLLTLFMVFAIIKVTRKTERAPLPVAG